MDQQPSGCRHYRFWQRGGGYDRNLTRLDVIRAEIDYIHANPVRRGLCATAEDWFWLSSADYAGLRTGPLTLDRQTLPHFVARAR